MRKYSQFIAKHPKGVLLVMTLLVIASYFGYQQTTINYDILTYLPQDLESTKGQKILDEQFHNASTGMLILEGTDQDAENLREKILMIDGVEDVLSKSSLVGEMVPKEILSGRLQDTFYADGSTLMVVKFKDSASSMSTMAAIDQIRAEESNP